MALFSPFEARNKLTQFAWLTNRPAFFVWAILVGVAAAGMTVLFHMAIHWGQLLTGSVPGEIETVVSRWSTTERVLFPVVGGLIAGTLLWLSSKVRKDMNADYMEAVALSDGRLSLRQGALRVLSSLSTVVTGGSIGREGAMVHLGAMIASAIGRFLAFNANDIRLLVACGAAAGVSAAYNAPLAAALFVAEIVLGTLSVTTLGPLIISAGVANITMQLTGYYRVTYDVKPISLAMDASLLLLLALAVVAGLLAPLFLRFLDAVRQLFRKTRLPLPFSLALGGALLGGILILQPAASGNGYGPIEDMLTLSWTIPAVLLMLAYKVLATGATVGSGATGGVFTPMLMVGASVGMLFFQIISLVMPELAAQPSLYILIGMGAFLAAGTHAPLMTILMIFEMTQQINLVLPLMFACVIANVVSSMYSTPAMYGVTLSREQTARLRRQISSMTLKGLVIEAETVLRQNQTLEQAVAMFQAYPVRYIYVIDENDHYQGVLSNQEVTRWLLSQSPLTTPISELMVQPHFIPVLHPDMTLAQGLELFLSFMGERLPVLLSKDEPVLLGVVRKSAILEQLEEQRILQERHQPPQMDFRISGDK
ncbi:ClcB-like voltage-gated chloride channel protein [Advenella mimigardefordensis]|uniref:Putative ClcB-like chloride channel protein n=1 Tax=Advenella mimigardefordensis (strain DSM 17166 / LMG 22922 / DPN7) TaxID=1247726 RepID=W0PA84_ADVMD|nr:ClcB-like voltage-gated chloride channel protein [Advenella mimigardefordensis]AHG63739.1 putative ClcB-like chloride channel protein [Advenella mimigardefordensis DPN7]